MRCNQKTVTGFRCKQKRSQALVATKNVRAASTRLGGRQVSKFVEDGVQLLDHLEQHRANVRDVAGEGPPEQQACGRGCLRLRLRLRCQSLRATTCGRLGGALLLSSEPNSMHWHLMPSQTRSSPNMMGRGKRKTDWDEAEKSRCKRCCHRRGALEVVQLHSALDHF